MEKNRKSGFKWKSLIFTLVCIVALNGCGNSNQEASAAKTETAGEETSKAEETSAPAAKKVLEVSRDKVIPSLRTAKKGENEEKEEPKISGFHKKTNQSIVFGGIEFSFPAYFDVLDEESTEDRIHYYPEEKDYYCSLMFQKADLAVSQEEFENKKSEIALSAVESFGQDKYEVVKSEAVTIAGLSGWSVFCSGRGREKPSTLNVSFVYNPDSQQIIFIFEIYDSIDESNYDYDGDYKKIIESANLAKTEAAEQESETAAEKVASNGLNPEFKAMMDSYEEFFNSYVEFMKRYTESDNPIGMLKEYTEFMQKYMDAMEKLESVDAENLSTEDYKYYIDVYSRISKKLLEVYD